MRRNIFLALLLVLSLLAGQYAHAQAVEQRFYQVSTIDALMKGHYHGYVPFGVLKAHGDFGLGTLDGLDGEMVALDGRFYQVRSDGQVFPISDTSKTPFAVVTFFKAQAQETLPRTASLTELKDAVERLIPCKAAPYAVKVTGYFPLAHVRSVPRQNEPYPDLDSALHHQVKFELRNIRGTLVGFRFPRDLGNVNVSGYHFHFISDDRHAGGHMLDCVGEALKVELVEARTLTMEMPESCRKDTRNSKD